MDEREALLAAIREDAEDDTARLVFADWLQEQGDEARAEFVRVQVRIARLAENDPEQVNLLAREAELLANHSVGWVGEYPINALIFRRGFLDTLNLARGTFPGADDRYPVAVGDAGISELTASWHLAGIATLNLKNCGISAVGVAALAACKHLANLTTLDLSYNQFGNTGVAKIIASPYLTKLVSLRLVHCAIDDSGATALASAPSLANLTTLLLRRDWSGGFASEVGHGVYVSRMALEVNRISDGAWATLKARFGDRVRR